MASYPQSVLDEIRAAVDIVDVVNRFVNLKKAGQNWKGLCPFHTEKTPSFMVNEKKGIFHCFGCGVGGDAFGFLMRQDKLSFPEAVRALPKQAGGAAPREGRSGVYDRFRGRLLFAIRDLQGRVVAFGGRAFGDEQPKYLNSPETPLYVKGNLLYAADLARAAIQAKNRALLVEGYVDCLMAHQHGFTETVAALGTAFTPAQLGLLRRYCDDAVLFFDADAAGRKAAERAEELLEPTGASMAWAVNRTGALESSGALRLRVALLPVGHDPDTFLRTTGAAAFEERIGAARSLLSYALDRTIADPEGATRPRARTHAFARAPVMLAIVAALRLRLSAPAESLMTDLVTDEARSVLAALLVEERAELDVRVSIEQFRRRLERSQRLRRAREVSQSIADVQAKTGAAAPPLHEELRMLHQETAVIYEITGGVAQSLEPRAPGSEGAETHE